METIEDIVREMMNAPSYFVDDENGGCRMFMREEVVEFAKRIEAAWKREREAVESDALTVGGVVEAERHKPGNAAAIRETLEAINCIDTRRLKRLLCELVEADIPDCGQINKTISAVDKAKAALAAPPRNCDVGTSEEQSERYDEFCNIHDCRSDCPLFMADSCEFAWAQMPYKAAGESEVK